MPWPTEELNRRFSRPENADLLRYLEDNNPHAHSDAGLRLEAALKKLPGAGLFGPNITACSYVFAHTKEGVAFALAVGMRSLAFRLPAPYPDTRPFADIGQEWREFDPFEPSRGKARNLALIDELAAAGRSRGP